MTKIAFVGSKKSGLLALENINNVAPVSMVITCDDHADGRSALDEFSEFKAHVFPNSREGGRQAVELLLRERPDFVFVHGWYWLLPSALTEQATVVGIHNSLLPKYRGGAPLVWAIINGDNEVGASIFRIREGTDSGEIYGQFRISVHVNDHIGDVMSRLDNAVQENLGEIWADVLSGRSGGEPQNDNAATYCSQRKPEDGSIDWHLSAERVHNFIRAQSPPYPGAFSACDGKRFIITRSRIFDRPYLGTPGQVVQRLNDMCVVACGNGRAVCVEAIGLRVGMRLSSF